MKERSMSIKPKEKSSDYWMRILLLLVVIGTAICVIIGLAVWYFIKPGPPVRKYPSSFAYFENKTAEQQTAITTCGLDDCVSDSVPLVFDQEIGISLSLPDWNSNIIDYLNFSPINMINRYDAPGDAQTSFSIFGRKSSEEEGYVMNGDVPVLEEPQYNGKYEDGGSNELMIPYRASHGVWEKDYTAATGLKNKFTPAKIYTTPVPTSSPESRPFAPYTEYHQGTLWKANVFQFKDSDLEGDIGSNATQNRRSTCNTQANEYLINMVELELSRDLFSCVNGMFGIYPFDPAIYDTNKVCSFMNWLTSGGGDLLISLVKGAVNAYLGNYRGAIKAAAQAVTDAISMAPCKIQGTDSVWSLGATTDTLGLEIRFDHVRKYDLGNPSVTKHYELVFQRQLTDNGFLLNGDEENENAQLIMPLSFGVPCYEVSSTPVFSLSPDGLNTSGIVYKAAGCERWSGLIGGAEQPFGGYGVTRVSEMGDDPQPTYYDKKTADNPNGYDDPQKWRRDKLQGFGLLGPEACYIEVHEEGSLVKLRSPVTKSDFQSGKIIALEDCNISVSIVWTRWPWPKKSWMTWGGDMDFTQPGLDTFRAATVNYIERYIKTHPDKATTDKNSDLANCEPWLSKMGEKWLQSVDEDGCQTHKVYQTSPQSEFEPFIFLGDEKIYFNEANEFGTQEGEEAADKCTYKYPAFKNWNHSFYSALNDQTTCGKGKLSECIWIEEKGICSIKPDETGDTLPLVPMNMVELDSNQADLAYQSKNIFMKCTLHVEFCPFDSSLTS